MTKTVLGSENTQYGFYGTINNCNSTEETEHKWAEAFTTLLELSVCLLMKSELILIAGAVAN